jgi:hypothetical protein
LNDQEQAKSELIKSVDSFFGFKIKESIVLLFVDEEFTTSHHVRLDNDLETIDSIAGVVQRVPPKAQAQGVICISVSEDMEKAQRILLEAMRIVLLCGSLPLDALATDGQIWESLTGENGIIDDTPSALEYALASRGIFNFGSREEAIADIHKTEPSEGVAKEIEKLLATCPIKHAELALWRKEIIEFCEGYAYAELTDADVAKLAFASADIATSHALIYHLAVTEKPSELMHLWQRVFRRTPDEYRFAVAEILAWSFALEGSRWFIPEIIPYCNEASPTFRAMLMGLDNNISPHMMSLAMQKSAVLNSKDKMESMLAPMVSSAVKYLVENRKDDLNEE